MGKSIVQQNFQLMDNYISEFSLDVFEKIGLDRDLDININMSFSIVNVIENDLLGQIELQYNIDLKDNNKKQKNEVGKILITMNAIFKSSENISVDDFVEKLKTEGVQTLSHLCRAYISSTTAMSGMPTIMIPLINFSDFKSI